MYRGSLHGFGAEVDGVIYPLTVTGRSCEVGCARIGAFLKRNFPYTWGSSSLYTMSESGAKRCFLRSLSYWSLKIDILWLQHL